MEVICLEDDAFYALVEQVVQRIKEKEGIKEVKWISGEEAMKKLRITSKTTLQKLRDEGKIRFSKPEKAHFLRYRFYLSISRKKRKRNILNMSNQQMQYIRGFNSGYLLARHIPTLLVKIVKNIRPTNDFTEGLFPAKKNTNWNIP